MMIVAVITGFFFYQQPANISKQHMDIFKKSVAIACVGPSDPHPTITKTIGSCVIFTYKRYTLIVSCRHVIEPELGNLTIKTLVKIQNSGSEDVRDVILRLTNNRNWRFHPDDTDQTTRDIALFWFGPASDQLELLHLPDEPAIPRLRHDDPLIVLGYPIVDLSRSVILDTTQLLPLRIIEASYIDDVDNHRPGNYSRTVIQQNYAAVRSDANLDGISGGLVLSMHDNVLQPIGIVTAAGRGRIRQQSQVNEINFVAFTNLTYVYDLLRLLR